MRLAVLVGLVVGLLLAGLAPAPLSRAASTASYTLYGDASLGWGLTPSNITNPGPTLVATSGSLVSLQLFSHDGLEHEWFLDLNGNGFPDTGEPTSPLFNSSSVPTRLNFTVTFPAGNYTYYCYNHPPEMHGTFVIRPQGDGTPPVVVLGLSGPSGGGGWYRGAVTATLTAYDNDSGVQSLLYSEDGVTWHDYLAPLTFYNGVHTLKYYAIDNSGSVATLHSVPIWVDTVPPIISFKPLPATVTESRVTVSWSGYDQGSGMAGYEVRVDGGAPLEVGSNLSFTADFADGAHAVQVTAFDLAGNAANETIAFRVDTNPFSPSGPYGGAPTYAIVIVAALAVAWIVLWRRNRSRRPPAAPPEPGEPPRVP